MLVSALLGLALTESSLLSSLHMGLVLVAVVATGTLARTPAPILAVTLYAGVCDVLWRATGARGPYEASKYAIIFGGLCLIVRIVRHPRFRLNAIGIVVLLIPGAVLTASRIGVIESRELVAANLAGLVALAVLVAACGNLRLTPEEFRGAYLIVLGSTVSLTASATLATIRATDLSWTDEVNFTTSGGFGPNQVSSLLGLGALLCALVVIQPQSPWRLRAIALLTATWLVGQMVLTFSRGGVFGLVLGLVAIGLTALLTSGQRVRTIVAAALLMVIGLQIMSWAGAFTGGASDERFASTNSTNRWAIAAADVDLFWSHPAFGVGPGMARFDRDFRATAAHTEYSRLLGEHGVLGAGVLILLASLTIQIIRSASGWHRLAAVGLLVMALSQMTHSATRIGSIAVAFGLAALREDG